MQQSTVLMTKKVVDIKIDVEDAVDTMVVVVLDVEIAAFNSVVDGLVNSFAVDVYHLLGGSDIGFLISEEDKSVSKGVEGSYFDLFGLADPRGAA
ncbi:hypothetical protein NDU88_008541 [Pleurodeles waltl]|uniref:Uncharacterized protein n=1 Tax=Pleurodeles waltl TaxID=8319 RepID=A0AAV7PQ32_PLEWA|nr:hypothetical protein NDU88_008541 [Pleurodeles waltl]